MIVCESYTLINDVTFVISVGSREAAFVYSVSSAGVVHAITRACSKGTLVDCACDPTKYGSHKDNEGNFAWGGCSDNVKYGISFARHFVDARERKTRDARAVMNIHNNRVGRRVRYCKLMCDLRLNSFPQKYSASQE